MSFALVSPVAEAITLVFFSRSLQKDNIPSNFTIRDSGEPKEPWVANTTAHNILTYTYFAYPLILLAFFIGVFTYESIVSSNQDSKDDDSTTTTQLGPGGKPLPPRSMKKKKKDKQQDVLDFSRPRKLLFIWLSLVVLLSLIGNGALIVAHSVYSRDEEWWPGQPYVVSRSFHRVVRSRTNIIFSDLRRRVHDGLCAHRSLHIRLQAVARYITILYLGPCRPYGSRSSRYFFDYIYH